MTNTVTHFKGIGKFALTCLGLMTVFCGIIAGLTGGILYRQTRIDRKLDNVLLPGAAAPPQQRTAASHWPDAHATTNA